MSTAAVGHQYDRKTPEFCERLLAKFGKNPYGQNLYRVVWSETQFELVGGTWDDHVDPNQSSHLEKVGNFVRESNPTVQSKAEYRRVPKYPGVQRWVLEKWLPPSYSREEYYERFRETSSGYCSLGPYMEQGDFHCCYRLERHGLFMPLTMAVVEYYCRLLEAGRDYSAAQRKVAQEERVRREKKDWENRFDAIFDEAQLAGGTGNLFMPVSGRKASKARVKPEDVSFGKVEDLPAWVPRTAGVFQI